MKFKVAVGRNINQSNAINQTVVNMRKKQMEKKKQQTTQLMMMLLPLPVARWRVEQEACRTLEQLSDYQTHRCPSLCFVIH